MGVFSEHDSGGMADMESPKSLRPCKRDYEAEIARVKKQSDATKALAKAVENYIDLNGKGNRDFTLTSLYGALVLEARDQDRGIVFLQEQWEADK